MLQSMCSYNKEIPQRKPKRKGISYIDFKLQKLKSSKVKNATVSQLPAESVTEED